MNRKPVLGETLHRWTVRYSGHAYWDEVTVITPDKNGCVWDGIKGDK